MIQPMKEYWDSRAENYDTLFERSPIRFQIMEEIANKTPSSVLNVLDLGAGTGKLTERLLGKYPGAAFTLVDISAKMLECARYRFRNVHNIKFQETTFDELLISDSSIDLVVSAFALHHVNDDEKLEAAHEIFRVLRPDGRVIIADEMICNFDLTDDPAALGQRMIEIFYPFEDSEFYKKTFSSVKEYPSTPERLEGIFVNAGFIANVEQCNDIVGIITAKKAIRIG